MYVCVVTMICLRDYTCIPRYFTVVSVRNTSLMELRRSHFLTRHWSTFTLVGRRRPTSLTEHCRRLCHMGIWHCSMQMDRRRFTPRILRYTSHQFNYTMYISSRVCTCMCPCTCMPNGIKKGVYIVWYMYTLYMYLRLVCVVPEAQYYANALQKSFEMYM